MNTKDSNPAEIELQHQNQYLAALHETSLALLNRLDLPNLLEAIVSRAAQLLQSPEGFIFLTEPPDHLLSLKVALGDIGERVGAQIPAGQGLAGRVWQTGQSLQETGTDYSHDQHPVTILGVPLRSGQTIIGVIGISRLGSQPFKDEEISIIERFAHLACIALDNARLYTSAQQELEERRRVEQALVQEKERLAVTLRSIGDGVITTDLQGRVQMINTAAEQLTGWTQAEAIGQPLANVFHLIHAITRQTASDPMSQALEGERVVGLPNQTVLLAKDSKEWFISASTAPIRATDGQITGVVVTFRDITLHKRTEEALRKSEAQNRAILNAIPDLMFRMERQGTILDFKGNERDLTVTPEQVIGQPLQAILPQAVTDQKLTAIAAALNTGEMQVYSYQMAGSTGIQDFEARLVVSGHEEVLAIVQNVTARKKAEARQRQQVERERLLATIALKIRRSLHLDDILNTTAAEVRQLLKVDRVLIHQFQPNGHSSVIAEAVASRWPSALGEHLKGPWMIDSSGDYRRGDIRAIADLDSEDYALSKPLQDFLLNLNVRAILVVPLFQNSGIWGMLAAHFCEGSRSWQADEIGLLEKLATQVEIALQQAQLYQQVQTLNDELERKVRVRTAQLNKQVGALQLQAQLLDAVESAVVATDRSGFIIYWNAHAQELYGFSEEAALGELITDVIPFTRNQIESVLQALSQGDKWSGEIDAIRLNGTKVTVLVEHSPMRSPGGNPRGLIGVSVEITERKHAEHALRESEEKFRTLAETASSAIFIFREHFLDVNSALCQLTEFSREELLQMSVWQVVHPKYRQLAQKYGRLQLQGTPETLHHEFKIITQTGQERWVDCTTSLIQFKGSPAILGTAFDVTQRKASELELQTKMKELEQLNLLKDDFLSTVSHELRTPMSNMRMAIHMLRMTLHEVESQVPDLVEPLRKSHRYIDVLHQECMRETELINDLLDLQRLEAGSQVLEFEPIELDDWLPNLVHSFTARTQQRHQILELMPTEGLPILYTDRPSLGRVLAELLNNACKYSPPEATIRLSILTQPDRIQFLVTNTGVVIPEMEIEHIFEKFYRIPNGDRWKQGGTGLGLALIKRLVQELKGTIWVESSFDQTTFVVELPRYPESLDA